MTKNIDGKNYTFTKKELTEWNNGLRLSKSMKTLFIAYSDTNRIDTHRVNNEKELDTIIVAMIDRDRDWNDYNTYYSALFHVLGIR